MNASNLSDPAAPRPGLAFLAGDSETARCLRAIDWRAHPLGEPEQWSGSLKAMVRLLLTTQHPGIVHWGPESYLFYNDAFSASLGPEKHPSSLGRSSRVAWSELWPTIGPQIEHVLAGRGATWHENQLVPIIRHGRLTDVYWTYSFGPIDDATAPNGIGGVLVLCTETTQQVELGRRLALERERFAALFDQAPTFMAMLRGPEHVFEMANPAYLRLVGNRPVVGLRVADALPEAAAQGYVALLDEVWRSGKAHAADGSRFVAHGSSDTGEPVEIEHFLDFVYQPILNELGAVDGIFVQGVDVTERHRAEQALRHAEDRLRMAVDAARIGSFELDLEGHGVTFSDIARQVFAMHADELTMAQCLARVPPEDVVEIERAIAAARTGANEGAYRIRHRVLPEPGVVRWINVSGRVVEQGGREMLVGVLWDITEQQHLFDALQLADRRKDEFVATLAHELRNPLSAVRSAAHLLARPELTQELIVRCADVVGRQSASMASLLDDLLDAARITSGKLVLHLRAVRLGAVIEEAVEGAQAHIDARRHALTVDVAEPGLVFEGDPVRLAQVLGNLLTNAAKYTEPGGRIELRAWADRERIQLSVRDNGIGLMTAALPRIFEMFHQVRGASNGAQGGLGIGLSVTRALVELHGGRITAESAGLGQGSTFRVELPRRVPESALREGDGRAAAVRVAGLRVLLADDNVDAAQALATTLELEGHELRVVHDGEAAWNLARQWQPEVALLDIGMPKRNGLETARLLRAAPHGEQLFLVAVTGWGQEADRERTRAAGFDRHLTKPVDPKDVVALLRARAAALAGGPAAG